MRLLILTFFILTLYSCKNTSENKSKNTIKAEFSTIGKFPDVINIDSLKNTDFVPTMETHLDAGKNIIYCPTLLYAWDEIRKITGELKVHEDKDSRDLIQLNESKSYLNALANNEYRTRIEVVGDVIRANAEFNTELTFKPYLEKMKYPLIFKQNNVNGFGMIEYNMDIANQVEILYFKDNENFIFKLNPEQKDNEIIFAKGAEFNNARTFAELAEEIKESILFGNNEKKNKINIWKYILKEHETFAIPELAFNIEKSFNKLINKTVYHDLNFYTIKIAKQRNALLLNNKGAKIESEAEIEVEAAAAPSMDDNIIEKHMFLNNTFFILFKHNSKPNPYFCVKIDTDELMSKYKE